MARKFKTTPAALPPGATEPAGARRQQELTACRAQVQELMAQYGAGYQVQQVMQLDAEGRPRYTYIINIVSA